jgi:hypothetical protein
MCNPDSCKTGWYHSTCHRSDLSRKWKLQLEASQLHPCHKRVAAVGESILICKGWITVKSEINGHSSTQPLYFCDKVDRIYFSKQGCIEANILSSSFPFPMSEKVEQLVIQAAAIKSTPVSDAENCQDDEPASRTPQVERTSPPPRPAQLPFPAIEENILRMEELLKQEFASSAFNTSPPFPAMNAPPAHIHLIPNSKPYARHSPISVPRHWEKRVKGKLDYMVEHEIIKTAPIGSPVTWCSPMVTVAKHDFSPRICIDFQRLNASCLRETHHTPSPFMLASQIPPHQWKTVLDAVDGYHAVLLV